MLFRCLSWVDLHSHQRLPAVGSELGVRAQSSFGANCPSLEPSVGRETTDNLRPWGGMTLVKLSHGTGERTREPAPGNARHSHSLVGFRHHWFWVLRLLWCLSVGREPREVHRCLAAFFLFPAGSRLLWFRSVFATWCSRCLPALEWLQEHSWLSERGRRRTHWVLTSEAFLYFEMNRTALWTWLNLSRIVSCLPLEQNNWARSLMFRPGSWWGKLHDDAEPSFPVHRPLQTGCLGQDARTRYVECSISEAAWLTGGRRINTLQVTSKTGDPSTCSGERNAKMVDTSELLCVFFWSFLDNLKGGNTHSGQVSDLQRDGCLLSAYHCITRWFVIWNRRLNTWNTLFLVQGFAHWQLEIWHFTLLLEPHQRNTNWIPDAMGANSWWNPDLCHASVFLPPAILGRSWTLPKIFSDLRTLLTTKNTLTPSPLQNLGNLEE